MRLLLLVCLLLTFQPAVAERFLGLGPGDRLGDIFRKFPDVQLRDVQSELQLPYERSIEIRGPGINGTVGLTLHHEAKALEALVRSSSSRTNNTAAGVDRDPDTLQEQKIKLESLRKKPPSDPWKIDELQWRPGTRVSRSMLISRYGPPSQAGRDEQFRNRIIWEHRGIDATLNEEGDAKVIIFTFTIGDYFCAEDWRNGIECDPLLIQRMIAPQTK